MSELLPCPFCGGEAETHPTYDIDTKEVDGWFAWCAMANRCAVKPQTDAYTTEAEAIAAWNTRAERTCKMSQAEPPKIMAGWYRCSTCGDVYPPCNPEIAKWALQYCPRCGAKVVEQ